MTIGELSNRTGVPASTIRFWEKVGVLPKPMRVSRQRRYTVDAVERLAVVRLAQACGFGLKEMRHLLDGFAPSVRPSHRWQDLARRKQQEIVDEIARLKTMRRIVDQVLVCHCATWDECGRVASSVIARAQ